MLRPLVVAFLLAGGPLAPPRGAGAVAWQDPVGIAAGRGEKGPWRQNESRYDHVDDGTVAFGPGGGLVLAWASRAGKDVWLRPLSAGGRLSDPVNVARSPATCSWLPRLAHDGASSHLHALWQERIFSGGSHGGDILFARSGRPQSLGIAVSGDGGRGFSAPAVVPGGAAPAGGSDGSQQGWLGRKLAVDGTGRIALVNSSLVPGQGSRVWLMHGEVPPVR
jgi:hypothetical protein